MKSKIQMRPCHVIEIITPKKYVLDGLWFGPKRPKRCIVWVHGLGSSMFSKLSLVEHLVDAQTAVLMFNNRGHDRISRLVRTGEKKIGKTTWAGGACEVFTDSIDDMQGVVNFARKQGAKRIFLAGHSTGSQKSVYYASKRSSPLVKGLILMVPLSDYSVALRDDTNGQLARATRVARALVRAGKPHELLPQSVWPAIDDAQRFLSLYTPDSIEEMFTYAQPNKNPRIYTSVTLPILTIFAGADEFADRPAKEIASWFEKHTRSRKFKSVIIPKVGHGFKGAEKRVAEEIRTFIKTQ